MASQVTEPIASPKKDMKRNENLQKNPRERVTKTRREKGKKSGSIFELVLVIFVGSKANAAGKTEWKFLKQTNAVFYSSERFESIETKSAGYINMGRKSC